MSLHSVEACESPQEKIGTAKITRFWRQRDGGLAKAYRPGNARIDLRPDARAGDGERLHDGTRGFAARNDQATYPSLDEPARDLSQRCLDEASRALAAEAVLHRAHVLGRDARRDQER